jgi:putative oxygen-independent coproporphyrinogen III oxidase
LIPLSIYVHFPWCVRKCPYCDFNSHEARSVVPESDYLAALIRDLDAALPDAQNRPATSVFIGGGTPSLMTPATVATLLAAIRARVALVEDAEISLEANPGAIEADKFAAFRAAGITRLSLGIQSFDDGHLQAIGRIHSSNEARRAADLALEHFERVNFDLMYALPGQTPPQAHRDIETAIAFGPGHVSAYHLTIEPNTAFHRAPPALPDDDLAADMQEMVEATLAEAGYGHYETSAFAKPGQQCQHNLNYWTFGDYLGIGPGAHAKITHAGRMTREMRRKHPADYLRSVETVQERRTVPPGELPGEFMMNALRLIDGFAPELFEQRTGLPLASVDATLRQAQEDGLLTRTEQRIAPTPLGQRHLNALIARFIE